MKTTNVGGNPTAPSSTVTLLRLHSNRHLYLNYFPPVKVRIVASGRISSPNVTGGVYKTRERIHRSIADLRLLAIPTSCRRVAAYNPN